MSSFFFQKPLNAKSVLENLYHLFLQYTTYHTSNQNNFWQKMYFLPTGPGLLWNSYQLNHILQNKHTDIQEIPKR